MIDQINADDVKNLSIQEICAKFLFGATDAVSVTNPTNEPYRWDMASEDVRNERGQITRRIDTFEVRPGEEAELPAAAAYIYIDYMVKYMLGRDGNIGHLLQPNLVLAAIDKVFVGANRSADMLDKVRVSTIADRAKTNLPVAQPAAPSAPAPQNGAFDPSDLGLDESNMVSPEDADPAPSVATPPAHDPLPGLNNAIE